MSYTPDAMNRKYAHNLASMDAPLGDSGVTYHSLLEHPSLLFGDPERIAIFKEDALQSAERRRKDYRT